MFYIVRVNAAVAELGVNPNDIKQDFRMLAQAFGKQNGFSPQEAAILLVSKLPIEWKIQLTPGPVRKWVRERKVNAADANVQMALTELGWYDFLL